jgi:hypothetical protein
VQKLRCSCPSQWYREKVLQNTKSRYNSFFSPLPPSPLKLRADKKFTRPFYFFNRLAKQVVCLQEDENECGKHSVLPARRSWKQL